MFKGAPRLDSLVQHLLLPDRQANGKPGGERWPKAGVLQDQMRPPPPESPFHSLPRSSPQALPWTNASAAEAWNARFELPTTINAWPSRIQSQANGRAELRRPVWLVLRLYQKQLGWRRTAAALAARPAKLSTQLAVCPSSSPSDGEPASCDSTRAGGLASMIAAELGQIWEWPSFVVTDRALLRPAVERSFVLSVMDQRRLWLLRSVLRRAWKHLSWRSQRP